MHEHKRSQRGKSHHITYLQDGLQAPQSGENNEGMRMVDITVKPVLQVSWPALNVVI